MPKISGLTLALKRIPSAAYLYAVLGVAVIGAWQANNYHQREVGKRDLLIAQHERTNADLRKAQDSLAKQYRVDTIWRRVTKTRVDTMATTVEVWKHDTLRVVEFVEKAKDDAKSCSMALATCEQRVGVAERGWDNARDENKVLKQQVPSKMKPWTDRALGAAAMYGLGRLAHAMKK